MVAMVLGHLPPQAVNPGFEYVLGKPDKAGAYAGPGDRLSWGSTGEGFSALPLWLGTMAFVYFGDQQNGEKSEVFKAWHAAFNAAVLPHQAADGGWDVDGSDAKYGRVWRTSLIAFSLILMNPPPVPQPSPSAPAPNENAPAKKANSGTESTTR
jgi:hypothetical protein